MSYYETIDEDIKRAREILEKGRGGIDILTIHHPDGTTHTQRGNLGEGAIYGADIYAAYKLLESFVAEIERLQPWQDAIIDACVVDWILTKEHETDPRKAVNDLLAWQQQLALDPAISEPAAKLHTQIAEQTVEIERLRALVDAVGEKVCETALRLEKRVREKE